MRNTEQIAPAQLVGESGDGLLAQVARVRAQVDEIARVHADGQPAGGLRLAERLRVGGRDLLRPPHPAGFREDLHGLGAVTERAREGLVQAPRGAFVCSQEHGRGVYSLAARLRDISFQLGMKNLQALSSELSIASI